MTPFGGTKDAFQSGKRKLPRAPGQTPEAQKLDTGLKENREQDSSPFFQAGAGRTLPTSAVCHAYAGEGFLKAYSIPGFQAALCCLCPFSSSPLCALGLHDLVSASPTSVQIKENVHQVILRTTLPVWGTWRHPCLRSEARAMPRSSQVHYGLKTQNTGRGSLPGTYWITNPGYLRTERRA